MESEVDKNHIFPFLWMRGEDESIMREEIEKIYECGIRAICVEARPHKDFCGSGWWHDMDIVIDEAKKRDMKIWILDDKHFPTGYANGLIESKYPDRRKTYINYTTADIFGSSKRLTLQINSMLRPVAKLGEFEKPVNEIERLKNQLVSIVAIRIYHGKLYREETVNLMHAYDGEFATFQLPEGEWRVFVIYQTRTDGGKETYINVIDETSALTQIEGVYESHYAKYGDLFGNIIAGFFSDEPQFGNLPGFVSNAVIGKTQMPLPWSAELESMLKERYGDNLYTMLPYLWCETKEMEAGPQIRYDYMDCVSKLYEKNFSSAIGRWCDEHHVEYVGHVVEDEGAHSRLGMGAAHYFRAMSGQHMAGIDCIGGQVVYGSNDAQRIGVAKNDGEFYHYTLGKMGASCGHLDPRKQGRTMCELFGAYGWKFGIRDMKYLLDHFLVRGVNYLVPHAFSMSEYPDRDCPPHFYARGNNPQFPYFVELMKYGNRRCELLSGGIHIASVAILYDAEAEWAGERMAMQKVGRTLTENQIDFDIVSLDMLCDNKTYYGTKIEDGILRINNERFQMLIVPYTQRITKALAEFIEQAGEFPVVFVDQLPEKVVNSDKKSLSPIVAACDVMKLEVLAKELKGLGYYDVLVEPEFKELSVYHYVKERHVFMLLNESLNEIFCGKIHLSTKRQLVICDNLEDNYQQLPAVIKGDVSIVEIHLYPGQSCIIMEEEQKTDHQEYCLINRVLESCNKAIDISQNWQVSKVIQKQYPQFSEEVEKAVLAPISDGEPGFSGLIRYRKVFTVNQKVEKAFLQCQYVYESMTVWINNQKVGSCISFPYQMSIGQFLKEGDNEIGIEIATTLHRDQLNYPQSPLILSHETMEPTGMYGNIVIKFS